MDFGNILETWEKDLSVRGKEGAFQRQSNPLYKWLRVNPVYDKDLDNTETPADAGERRRRLRSKRPDAEIDLHGLSGDEAWKGLEVFFKEGRRRGLEKLLVIHGKGNHSRGEGRLKKLTAQFIEKCPFAGESGYNAAAEGGSGATWVILKEA